MQYPAEFGIGAVTFTTVQDVIPAISRNGLGIGIMAACHAKLPITERDGIVGAIAFGTLFTGKAEITAAQAENELFATIISMVERRG
ncbi:hypothetical protein Xszus_04085 [Xenorhabdus szentirmaii]|nr:hypothetical protein Xsze_01910 [Xenorhabdus szentirmaii DSM 16338]PHM44255.1 hypothetical protein Xszus_04085 [Xenorhabdus szentirmaii]